MKEVFVSYASADRERVRLLVERLKSEGLVVWWDRAIASGDDWERSLETALDRASCTIVCWTEASVASEWVRTEAVESMERGILVPVMLEDAKVPLRFRAVQARRLIGWPDNHDPYEWRTLIDEVNAKIAGRGPKTAQVVADHTERRNVVMLRGQFVHADGDIDPELIEDALSNFEPQLRSLLTSSGGYLLQYDASGFSCVFGAVQANIDDERSAGEVALRLGSILSGGEGLALRLGLATGLAVVTTLPDGTLRLVGNIAASAAELVEQARPGQIVVSGRAGRRLQRHFKLAATAHGSRFLLLPSTKNNETDGGNSVTLEPLIGRTAEMALVEAALRDASTGEGRAIRIIGDVGMGVTRLALEAAMRAQQQGCRTGIATGHNHDRTRPFGLFSDLLRNVLGHGTETPQQLLDHLLTIDSALRTRAPFLLSVLGGDAPELQSIADPQTLRRARGEAIIAALLSLASEQPLVLILDELHWVDEASLELIPLIAAAVATHPLVLLVCSPTDSPMTWPNLPSCEQITLRPFSRVEATQMVAALAKVQRVSDDLATLLHDRSDGVPLFIEELTRALIEGGQLVVDNATLIDNGVAEIGLTDSIEAVVRSRLDRLGNRVLDLLRVASVVGRQFERSFLDSHVADAMTVSACLDLAVTKGLLIQVRLVPEATYRFRHHAARKVAYDSLVTKERRALHAAFGSWLEANQSSLPGSRHEALAFHYREAGDRERGLRYALASGMDAVRAVAPIAAAEQFRNAIAFMDQANGIGGHAGGHDQDLMAALTGLGNSLYLVRGYGDAELAIVATRLQTLCDTAPASETLAAGLILLFRYYYNRARLGMASACAEQQLNLAQTSGNASHLSAALTADATIKVLRGEAAAALISVDAAIANADPESEAERTFLSGVSQLVLAHAMRGMSLMRLGRVDEGRAAFQTGRLISQQLGHPGSELVLFGYAQGAAMLVEDIAESDTLTTAMAALASTHQLKHWQAIARLRQAQILLAKGRITEGVAQWHDAAAGVSEMGVVMLHDAILADRARLALAAGDRVACSTHLAEAEKSMIDGPRQLEAEFARVELRLLWLDDPAVAETAARRKIEICVAKSDLVGAVRLAGDLAGLLGKGNRRSEGTAILQTRLEAVDPNCTSDAPLILRLRKLLESLQDNH
jgi:hypothetical protein